MREQLSERERERKQRERERAKSERAKRDGTERERERAQKERAEQMGERDWRPCLSERKIRNTRKSKMCNNNNKTIIMFEDLCGTQQLTALTSCSSGFLSWL